MQDQAETPAPANALAGIFGSRRKRGPGRDPPQELPTDPTGAEGSPPERAPRGRKVLQENQTNKTDDKHIIPKQGNAISKKCGKAQNASKNDKCKNQKRF
jgi:hypothetical protein